MSLFAGDLTTPQRVATWMAGAPNLPSPVLSQLIGSMTGLIYGKLSRSRVYSHTHTRYFNGVGNMQLVLPDYPVTSISSVQIGQAVIQPSVVPLAGAAQPSGTNPCYGYTFTPWNGGLPGANAVLEFRGGYFPVGVQNVQVVYTAGYLIQAEAWTVPSTSPYQITVLQPEGIWSRDNGVTYANGTPLQAVSTITGPGQYIIGPDSTPGLYTFGAADAGAAILISYSFIPAPLEEACIQMVNERYSYRSRIGEVSKSLGGQESVRFLRGGRNTGNNSLPPEVMDLISDYISVLPPDIGAPV